MLRIYRQEPPNISSLVGLDDTYVATGGATFGLVNKTAAELGSTIQFENVLYSFVNGGFTVDTGNNTFTLSSAPTPGAQGIAPPVTALVLSAYDQDDVTGITDPRIDVEDIYMFDIDEIHQKKYMAFTGLPGIEIGFEDGITSTGPDVSWVQIACTAADGSAFTYAATGQFIYTPNLEASGLISGTFGVGASSINCSNSLTFHVLDYVIINIGQATQEIKRISEKTGTKLGFTSNLIYSHTTNETVFACGRRFKGKLTVPLNATAGGSGSFYDLILRIRALRQTRT